MDQETKQRAVNTSALNEASLAQFAAKVAIVVFIMAAAAIFVISYADDVVRNRVEQVKRIPEIMPTIGGSSFWLGVEKVIADLADPKSDMPPEKKAKLLAEIRAISVRWRPFIEAATAEPGTSEKPATPVP